MAEAKTKRTGASVAQFIDGIVDEQVRTDCRAIVKMMQKATGAEPRMWGSSIVGFGSYRIRGASGGEAEWMLTAFAPRKRDITLYVMPFDGYKEMMSGLGKFTSGQSCLHIKRLADVHLPTLQKIVTASVRHMRAKYPPGSEQ